MPEEGSISIEQFLLTRLSKSDFKKWVENSSAPYKELMAYYRCAIMEIETKFKVLNEELSIQYDRNPIETIKSRLKTPESIFDKIARKGCPLTVESIEENITDIAGVRVICLQETVYITVELLLIMMKKIKKVIRLFFLLIRKDVVVQCAHGRRLR